MMLFLASQTPKSDATSEFVQGLDINSTKTEFCGHDLNILTSQQLASEQHHHLGNTSLMQTIYRAWFQKMGLAK